MCKTGSGLDCTKSPPVANVSMLHGSGIRQVNLHALGHIPGEGVLPAAAHSIHYALTCMLYGMFRKKGKTVYPSPLYKKAKANNTCKTKIIFLAN